jgi:MORN repeat protein
VKQLPFFTVIALALGILAWNFSFYGDFYRARGDRMTVRAEDGAPRVRPLTPAAFEDLGSAERQTLEGPHPQVTGTTDEPGGAARDSRRLTGSGTQGAGAELGVEPSGGPQIEDVVYRFADGVTVRSRGSLLDGQRVGRWLQYRENGQVLNQGEYADGERQGEWEFFYEDGIRRDVGSYERGQRTGLWRTYHPSGKLMIEGTYEADERTGAWAAYYTDGSPKESGVYELGVMQGYWEFYDPEGRLGPRTGLYRDGLRVEH